MKKASIAEMSAFVAIAERASFAKAAKQLGVSRSSLSESLRSLEERLGVRLVNRTTRSVAVTQAGERLLVQLRPLLDNFDAVLESVNAFRDSPAGHLRITVPRPAARTVIEPVLSRFLAAYPAVTLEVSIDSALTDLPEPDSPTSATHSPRLISNEIRSTASVLPACWWNATERSRMSSSGWLAASMLIT